MAVRILNGGNPAAIPFRNASMEALILNPDLAERYGLSISEAIRKKRPYIPMQSRSEGEIGEAGPESRITATPISGMC